MTKLSDKVFDLGTMLKCLDCGYEFDSSSAVDEGSTPVEDNSVSVCMRCGALAYFRNDGKKITHIERMPPEEYAECIRDPEVRNILMSIYAMPPW